MSTPINYVTVCSDKSRNVAIVLCTIGMFIPFCGGLHRLYVGKIITGLLYTATHGLFIIGNLIDLATLVTGQFTDNTGQPLKR